MWFLGPYMINDWTKAVCPSCFFICLSYYQGFLFQCLPKQAVPSYVHICLLWKHNKHTVWISGKYPFFAIIQLWVVSKGHATQMNHVYFPLNIPTMQTNDLNLQHATWLLIQGYVPYLHSRYLHNIQYDTVLDTFRYGALGFPSSLGSMLVSGVQPCSHWLLYILVPRFQGWKPFGCFQK